MKINEAMRATLFCVLILLSAGCERPMGKSQVSAFYLEFEHGFMVYWTSETCLYAYSYEADIIIPEVLRGGTGGDYAYCLEFNGLPDAPAGAPTGNFGRVWAYYPEVQAALGFPHGVSIAYTATLPPSDPPASGAPWVSPIITLPDASELHCGFRAATNSHCVVRAPQ